MLARDFDALQEAWAWDLAAVPPELTPSAGWAERQPLAPVLWDLTRNLAIAAGGEDRGLATHLAVVAFHAQAERAAVAPRPGPEWKLLDSHRLIIVAKAGYAFGWFIDAVARGKDETMAGLRLTLDLAEGRHGRDVLPPPESRAWKEFSAQAQDALWRRARRTYPDFFAPEGEASRVRPSAQVVALLGEIGLYERGDPGAPKEILGLRARQIGRMVDALLRRSSYPEIWEALPPPAQKVVDEAAGRTPLRFSPLRLLVRHGGQR